MEALVTVSADDFARLGCFDDFDAGENKITIDFVHLKLEDDYFTAGLAALTLVIMAAVAIRIE